MRDWPSHAHQDTNSRKSLQGAINPRASARCHSSVNRCEVFFSDETDSSRVGHSNF